MIPKELEQFKGIQKYPMTFFHYVYFLYDKKDLVYIGKTSGHLTTRLIVHQTDKDFTDCYILKFIDKETCSKKEKELICKFEPKYNYIPLKARYPKVGTKFKHFAETVKIIGIVEKYVIVKSKNNNLPFAISIEELQSKGKQALL